MPRPALTPQPEPRLSGENGDVAQKRSDGGFSLILMSIVITAGAMIMVSFLPGKEAGDYNAKTIDDIDKLNTVEEHMRSFMAANRRRPCPADGQYPINSPNFGREAAIAGTCQGGTPSAPLGPDTSTTNCGGGGCIVAGVIPTRSLGLDASYAFDSYGRRFTYVVDKRATTTAACIDLEGIELGSTTPTGKGGLYIDDIAGKQIDQVMYAYIQHGPSGYGAFPAQGSTAANRINSGSTDLAMQVDAGVAPGANPGNSTFSPDQINTLVKNSMTLPLTTGGKLDTGFNDLVWYRDDIKNTCCLGKACIPIGFRIDNSSLVYGIGDVNGDGIPDLVISGYSATWNYYIAVIFGTAAGWPIPPTGLDIRTQLNGTNGFVIDTWNQVSSVTVTDINGDGFADLFYCTSPKCYVVFGGYGGGANGAYLPGGATTFTGPCGGYTNTPNSNTGNNTSCVTIDTSGIDNGGSWDSLGNATTAAGTIDDSGYKSLVALGFCFAYKSPWSTTCSDTMSGFVLYGMPSGTPGSNTPGTWSGTSSLTVSSFNGTNGFEIHSSNANLLGDAWISLGQPFDFDNDGYGDIPIAAGHASGAPITKYGALYVIYGHKRADWPTSLTGTTPAFLDLATEIGANRATEFYNSNGNQGFLGQGGTIMGANIKGTGIHDLVSASIYTFPAVVYGGTHYPSTFDLNTLTSAQGFFVQTYNCCNGMPSWLSGFDNIGVADINGDGKNDLLLSSSFASPNGRSHAGVTLVYFQPTGGWGTASVNYNNFHWDGTDSFAIYGPEANSYCGYSNGASLGADVRPGDGGKPEIIVQCLTGEPGHSSVYGLYKNKGWPSSIDLNQLN